jgi:hypothetical protein
MIFDRIKSLFVAASAGKDKPSSPDRDELATILDEIKAARDRHAAAQASIASLTATIEGGVAAECELNALVASPSGVKGLAEFVAGGDKGAVSRGVDRTARAVQAAEAARRALPKFEGDLAEANAEIARLETSRKNKVFEIMTKIYGDRLAQQYLLIFRTLGYFHDHIAGYSRGCNIAGSGSVVMSSEMLEVPRFNLPSLACTGPYSPFLTHVPDQQTVSAAALAWSRFARRLAEDPYADVGADLSSDLVAEVGRHPEHGSELVWLPRRERHEPDLKEVIYGGEDRTRTHKIIGS